MIAVSESARAAGAESAARPAAAAYPGQPRNATELVMIIMIATMIIMMMIQVTSLGPDSAPDWRPARRRPATRDSARPGSRLPPVLSEPGPRGPAPGVGQTGWSGLTRTGNFIMMMIIPGGPRNRAVTRDRLSSSSMTR